MYPSFSANSSSKPFLALLGDRFSYSYFPFNRLEIDVLANRTKATYRASLGKPIVPIENQENPFEEVTIKYVCIVVVQRYF